MGLINDVLVWFWLMMAHWCQVMPNFYRQFAENVRALVIKSQPKLHPICL
jgi:hypothetical protein